MSRLTDQDTLGDHMARLHEQIEHLRSEFDATVAEAPYKELLVIIHKPGWTTPQEAALTRVMVNNMSAHIRALRQANRELLAAAREVGEAAEQ